MNHLKHLVALTVSIIWIGGAILFPLLFTALNQASVSVVPEYAPRNTMSQPVVTGVKTATQSHPRQVSVPSLGIEIGIDDGYYNPENQQWTLSETSAFYATPTSLIGADNGNTLIYGHNSDQIFGRLLRITSGSEAIITTATGDKFTYVYKSTEAVKPDNVTILTYQGNSRIILQTCSGIWNENRQMFYFELKSGPTNK